MTLLALLASPRFSQVQIHHGVDDRFDHSDQGGQGGQGGERNVATSVMRASMRTRSAAVTERLPVLAGAK